MRCATGVCPDYALGSCNTIPFWYCPFLEKTQTNLRVETLQSSS